MFNKIASLVKWNIRNKKCNSYNIKGSQKEISKIGLEASTNLKSEITYTTITDTK